MKTDLSELGQRARRRIALRLLPFLFLMYLICYVDRANVSFANLRMSADLGFSDTVYGVGVGIFFLGYVLFEVPGAIIVERWSARKWLARILITWGMVTVFTGFVQTARQFYIARLLLGVAEASFFPGVIVYLTHWFRQSDRAKAIAFFYCATPAASVIGSLVAGWLLGVHWRALDGWRWIFIVEGIPPIILGFITIFYLTDWPRQALWLSEEERNWISLELAAETRAKKRICDFTIWQAFRNKQVLLLIFPNFLALTAALGSTYWLPTFIKRLSGFSSSQVALLAALPGLLGIVAMLLNGWHSDKIGERRWHTAIPLLCAGAAYVVVPSAGHNFTAAMILFVLGGGIMFAFFPVFWSMPTMVLSETAAAACFGLINSIGQIGGIIGPSVVGRLNVRTGSLVTSLLFIGVCYLLAGSLIAFVRIKGPISDPVPNVLAGERTVAAS
jgi:MFS transporter, ACS family, tartrate transporter